MRTNNHLNTYNDKSFFDNYKKLIITFMVIFIILLIFCAILVFFFKHTFSMLIGYVMGSIISFYLFYIIDKMITNSSAYDLKKATKKIHVIHMISYLLSLGILFLIFKTYWVIIGNVIGLLVMKMAIFVCYIFKKNK